MKLTYGNDNTCELPSADVVTLRSSHSPMIAPADVAEQVRHAFAKPLDYPSLASASVPGDVITICLEYDTPQLPAVVTGVLAAVADAGINPSATTLLLAPEFAVDADAIQTWKALTGNNADVIVHQPDDQEQLALLGVTKAGRALRLNRALCDADVVIPVGPVRGDASDNFFGILFPRFSDPATIERFRSPKTDNRESLVDETIESDWMLGVGLTVQVVPGAGGEVAGIFCGTPSGSVNAARELYHEVWRAPVAGRADLVIASIVGNQSQQTWDNLARVLSIAENLIHTEGAIAVCTEIAHRPGPSGKRLRHASDLAEVERKILGDSFADSHAALQLCRRLQRGTVYLKSRLDAELVESLGLAPIESDRELARLVDSYHRCLVLEEAQHLEPQLVTS